MLKSGHSTSGTIPYLNNDKQYQAVSLCVQVQGLCGNMDGKPKNDLTTRFGMISDAVEVGDSWSATSCNEDSEVRRGELINSVVAEGRIN